MHKRISPMLILCPVKLPPTGYVFYPKVCIAQSYDRIVVCLRQLRSFREWNTSVLQRILTLWSLVQRKLESASNGLLNAIWTNFTPNWRTPCPGILPGWMCWSVQDCNTRTTCGQSTIIEQEQRSGSTQCLCLTPTDTGQYWLERLTRWIRTAPYLPPLNPKPRRSIPGVFTHPDSLLRPYQ